MPPDTKFKEGDIVLANVSGRLRLCTVRGVVSVMAGLTVLIVRLEEGPLGPEYPFSCVALPEALLAGGGPKERAKFRPNNFRDLSESQQREIDASLGLTDWYGGDAECYQPR